MDVEGVLHLLGMVNYYGRLSPYLHDLSVTLRNVLEKHETWCWVSSQSDAVDILEAQFPQPSVRKYHPRYATAVLCTLTI